MDNRTSKERLEQYVADGDLMAAEALVAAALQGVVWGVVRAVVQRAGAHSYQAITAERPPT